MHSYQPPIVALRLKIKPEKSFNIVLSDFWVVIMITIVLFLVLLSFSPLCDE